MYETVKDKKCEIRYESVVAFQTKWNIMRCGGFVNAIAVVWSLTNAVCQLPIQATQTCYHKMLLNLSILCGNLSLKQANLISLYRVAFSSEPSNQSFNWNLSCVGSQLGTTRPPPFVIAVIRRRWHSPTPWVSRKSGDLSRSAWHNPEREKRECSEHKGDHTHRLQIKMGQSLSFGVHRRVWCLKTKGCVPIFYPICTVGQEASDPGKKLWVDSLSFLKVRVTGPSRKWPVLRCVYN